MNRYRREEDDHDHDHDHEGDHDDNHEENKENETGLACDFSRCLFITFARVFSPNIEVLIQWFKGVSVDFEVAKNPTSF